MYLHIPITFHLFLTRMQQAQLSLNAEIKIGRNDIPIGVILST